MARRSTCRGRGRPTRPASPPPRAPRCSSPIPTTTECCSSTAPARRAPGCRRRRRAGSAPGQFDHPRGLAVAADGLWVADTGNRRIQRFGFPELAPDLEVAGGLHQPTGVATDSQGRLYVLDRGLKVVRRYTRHGLPDPVYDLAITASGRLADPLFLAVSEGDLLCVSDGMASAVRCFDETGAFTRDLTTRLGAWQPGALAFGANRLFVADAVSGQIMVFRPDGTYWCELPLFRGPVSALALSDAGDLVIKTPLDDTY